ncbi:MAG: hypothetical protein SPJ68_06490 [Arcanobacterium sp.]|nr:hypothetical protein [Arcanobacterium sp.]
MKAIKRGKGARGCFECNNKGESCKDINGVGRDVSCGYRHEYGRA